MERKQNFVLIIGGCAIDIISQICEQDKNKSFENFINNSNIGRINIWAGGSARNCAECLARLYKK